MQGPSRTGGLHEKLENMVQKLAIAEGFDAYDLKVESSRTEHIVEASIDPRTDLIEMLISENCLSDLNGALETHFGKYERYMRESGKNSRWFNRNLIELMQQMVNSVGRHEIRHWDFCPGSMERYAQIMIGTAQGLSESSSTKKKVDQKQIADVSNMFMDTVVNMGMYLHDNSDQEGLGLFYTKEGAIAGVYSEAYCIFVGIQTMIGMDDIELRNLWDIYKNGSNMEIMDKLQDGVKIFEMPHAYSKCINDAEKAVLWDLLQDQDRWCDMAYMYAKLFADNIEGLRETVPGCYLGAEVANGGSARDDFWEQVFKSTEFESESESKTRSKQGPGKGIPGKENGNCERRRGQGRRGQGRRGGGRSSGMQEKKETKKGNKGDPTEDQKGAGRGSGLVLQESAGFEAQDAFYKMHAQDVLAEMRDKQDDAGASAKLGYMARKVDEIDKVSDPYSIDWGRTFYAGNRVLVTRKLNPQTRPRDIEPSTQDGFFDVALFMDSSQSMGYKPFATTGKFNLLLIAGYSLLEYIEKQGYDIMTGCVNFSNESIWSGWHNKISQSQVRKTMLKYQGGGTKLGSDAIQKVRDEARGRYWQVIVTDGEISGWQEVADEFAKDIDKNPITIIQLNEKTSFYKRLTAAGADGLVLREAGDLANAVIGRADRVRGG